MIEASRAIENLLYTNNCCKSVADKIKYVEKKIQFTVDNPTVDNLLEKLADKLDVLKAEQEIAHKKRMDARQVVNDMFADLRG